MEAFGPFTKLEDVDLVSPFRESWEAQGDLCSREVRGQGGMSDEGVL